MEEDQEKIEHQIQLARRATALVSDEITIQRLKSFAEELKQNLLRMARRGKVRARSYELWEQAGKPPGRDLEFWLEAERQLEEERRHHEPKTPDTL